MGNQVIKCIIYTSNKEIGLKRLLDIENEKNKLGIKTIYKRIYNSSLKNMSNLNDEIGFEDGEKWIVVNPNLAARGYRYRKAYIDAYNTTIQQLYENIIPYGELYKLEEEKYFNF